jgi:hypothetical protein
MHYLAVRLYNRDHVSLLDCHTRTAVWPSVAIPRRSFYITHLLLLRMILRPGELAPVAGCRRTSWVLR